jgi:hypothetical protein
MRGRWWTAFRVNVDHGDRAQERVTKDIALVNSVLITNNYRVPLSPRYQRPWWSRQRHPFQLLGTNIELSRKAIPEA